MCNKNNVLPECAVAPAAEVYLGLLYMELTFIDCESHVRSFRDVNIPVLVILVSAREHNYFTFSNYGLN